ncbi:hypothetical protein GCM10009609_10530 [Pseudonocardia aurantiaca]|uniref:Arabinosyltransferase domain-containing protein n=1 Tax=Pseudonocardia aurantiaca TaxID=75290 RepID=A0ABW4FCN5_9PSEU
MTDVSDAVEHDAPARAEDVDGIPPRPAGSTPAPAAGRGRRTAVFAALSALVAVVCAAMLPFAPVSVNDPTVSWPVDPARPQSTLLSLTAYRPLAMDVRFTCDAARVAQANGGVVVSTAAPAAPTAGTTGMIVTARDGQVQVRGMDALLLDEPLPAGPCEYRITGDSRGLPSFVRPAPDPADLDAPNMSAFATPVNAHVTITRDGTQIVSRPFEQLPDVDVLATDARGLPNGGLSVQLRVDDEFTSSPTPVKSVLIWATAFALVVTALLLMQLARATPRVPLVWRLTWPRLVDLLVPAVIVFWMFVAPATDDDGYYAAMARNSVLSGEVGNYYQLYDQNFTPFTWFYQALGWWQQFAGTAPVLQRIPAAVFGVVTFFALRRFVAIAMSEWAPDSRRVRALAHAVLAVVFLAWWIPQNMGVRPETVVAMCGALTMLTVLVAGRRSHPALAWLAFALAGLGFTAHPTGFTLFAPLLAGLPLLWPVVRVPGHKFGTALRMLAVASGGMVAPLLAFADGALRDFIRGQAIFLSLQAQEGWTTEIQRYEFLLSQIPMGNYAKRAAILVCLVALLWFAVLLVAARARRVAVPMPLWLAGSSTALAFAALWLTPSKWSHHFGALAGVGPAFLALLLVTAVPLTRRVLQDAKLPYGLLAAAGASFVAVIALGWHGPNQWPYASLEGMRRPELSPAISNIALDSVGLWAGVAVVTGALLVGAAKLARGPSLRLAALTAVPAVVVLSLLGTTVYTVGTFGAGAAAGVPRESVWAQGLADPAGTRCGAAGVVRVLDPTTASTLPEAPGQPTPPAPVGFAPGAGYYEGNRPQGRAAAEIWGSLIVRDDRGAERNDGQMTTSWYTLPQGLTGAGVTVLAAGTLDQGNSLTAVYGRTSADGTVSVIEENPNTKAEEQQSLTDPTHSTSWRTFTLEPPAGADVVRLQAVDGTGGLHGWLAFSAPAVAQPVVLSDYLPAAAPVALAWPLAFAYPCQRQPTIVDGITESPQYAVLWGNEPMTGLDDGAWVPFRGGAFAQVPRTESVQRLAVAPGTDPHIEVYAFHTDLAQAAYTVTETRRTVSGASIDNETATAPNG